MAEIKISELSIGDWVMFTPNKKIYVAEPRFTSAPAKITGAYRGREVILEIGCKREFMAIPLSCIEPIPLTPEILEKNGISKTYESDEYAVYKGEGFNVTEYYTELWEFERHRNRLMIRYVHQLQHALRLAGVEKEIEV